MARWRVATQGDSTKKGSFAPIGATQCLVTTCGFLSVSVRMFPVDTANNPTRMQSCPRDTIAVEAPSTGGISPAPHRAFSM
jgi:hypothetical protein